MATTNASKNNCNKKIIFVIVVAVALLLGMGAFFLIRARGHKENEYYNHSGRKNNVTNDFVDTGPFEVGNEKWVMPQKSAARGYGFIQPWNKFDPPCTLVNKSDCINVPSSTSNVKPGADYDGIEVETDKWMTLACRQGKMSASKAAEGNGPFGAVMLQLDEDDTILRYWLGHNQVVKNNDPTFHAECGLIRKVCGDLKTFNIGKIDKAASPLPQKGKYSRCIIYSHAEPCAMCMSAIYWASIPVMLFAATRYDAAAQGVDFSDAIIYDDLSRSYANRKNIKVFQVSDPNSLDAFNTWKRENKTHY